MIDKIRFRTEGSMLVLEVATYEPPTQNYSFPRKLQWRDANVGDLLEVAVFIKLEGTQNEQT